MISQAHSDAARKNGAKSHGPVTPEGKARSSQNGATHGFKSRRIVLRNESVEIYNLILDAYNGIFQPVDIFESDCVQHMVNARWLIRRAEALTTAVYDLAIIRSEAELKAKYDNLDSATETAASLTLEDHKHINCYMKYEDRALFRFNRNYRLLTDYRKRKGGPALPSKEEAIECEAPFPYNDKAPEPTPEPPPPAPTPDPVVSVVSDEPPKADAPGNETQPCTTEPKIAAKTSIALSMEELSDLLHRIVYNYGPLRLSIAAFLIAVTGVIAAGWR